MVWLTAAVDMACGAGLPVLALFVTVLHFVIVFAFPYVVERLPKSRWTPLPLQVTYEDGRGILRDVLVICTQQDFAVTIARRSAARQRFGGTNGIGEPPAAQRPVVTVNVEIQGTRSVAKLVVKWAKINGVVSVNAGDVNVPSD